MGERLIGARSTDKLLADLYKLLLTLFAQPQGLLSSQSRSLIVDVASSVTGINPLGDVSGENSLTDKQQIGVPKIDS